MRYLLDTHAIIWYVEDSSELPKKITHIIDNPENEIYISSIFFMGDCFKSKSG